MEEIEKSGYLKDIEYFSAKVEQDPSSALFLPLGKTYLKLEQYEEAEKVLRAGIDANPDVFAAKTLLANAYMGQGKTDDAKTILTEVQVVDRCNYMASKLLGDILRNEDEIKKALVNYRTALMIAPEDQDLRNLVEELMASSGIAAHELEEDTLMEADDDMLEQLGSELAEEVKQEVGEDGFGEVAEASEQEVSEAVDTIVGVEENGDDMSLEKFQEDSGETFDEMEEELVASFDDEIIPSELSAPLESETDEGESPATVLLPAEVMESDGDEPTEEDIQALAAELGSDLGLEDSNTAPVQDEVDAALEEVFGDDSESTDETAESQDAGMNFFEDAEDDSDEPELDDDLKALLGEEPEADIEEPVADEHVEEAQAIEDLEALLDGAETASDDDPVDESSDAEETAEEVAKEEPAEEAEEVFESSVEELLQPQNQEESIPEEYKNLEPETREQVNRLENLLETIKNNSGS